MTQYSQEDIEGFQSKEKRISLQGFHRGICQIAGITEEQAWELAKKRNEEMYQLYPFVKREIPIGEPVYNHSDPSVFVKSMPKATGKMCPVCQSPMINQTNKANEKSPDWKCSNRGCKFQFKGGKWVPSQYITATWDTDIDKNLSEDAIIDEASHSY